MSFKSAKEVAGKWGITRRRVQLLCEQGRIECAYKVSAVWVIPNDAIKPPDKRKVNNEVNEK